MLSTFNRWVERLIGGIADAVLWVGHGRWMRQQQRRWRHRRALWRAVLRHGRSRPRLAPWTQRLERLIAVVAMTLTTARRWGSRIGAHVRTVAGAIATSSLGRWSAARWQHLRPRLVTFAHAHLEAWRWLGRLPGRAWRHLRARRRPLTAEDTDPAPTGATMPDGLLRMIACASCGHEMVGTNVRRYSRFPCPLCRIPLLVLDPQKGLSMALDPSHRARTQTASMHEETEVSVPVQALR